jgi:hypothetical protein
MSRRFQFSLGRLMTGTTLLASACACAWWSAAFHRLNPSFSAVALGAAFALVGGAIGLFLSHRKGPTAAFGAMLALIAFGLLACATIRAVE